MTENKTLKAVERKIFQSNFRDGTLDIFLAAFVSMFAIAPLLSGTLGDFWSSVIFLPFFGLVYLVLLFIRKRFINPRIGSVKWGEMRKKKLKRGSLVLLVINLVFLILGVVAFLMPLPSGWAMSLRFGLMMLILFSAAGYMLDFNILYIYGFALALALPLGEWLYQELGFSHHGFPAVFGALAVTMLARGLYQLISLLKENPLEPEDGTL